MINDRDTTKVISILGNDYTIKAPTGQEQTLMDAVVLLKSALSETKRNYPTLIGDRLLVLAALNLCSKQIELNQQHAAELSRYEQQVSATVEVIEKTIAQG
ncbi:cell division protein ZapA [Pseudomonas sp. GD03842]|uniref:cell division protein ZapA n=1 Tax=unclassified Pseudomonas TaxID=196821 RepID=UPI000D39116B|nr:MULTISPECIES: cell division protein ZapA [unclassified Pseudomonas]MDH0747357.1 cell division protein ZapA [Pseudomonas sp. GD03842]RAU46201.1 cell division protein ZapA [Pseudomonas sp. RIT 409]RAU53753.1 cell division protein ZapA [Pseudomonas sp. RIT 412]